MKRYIYHGPLSGVTLKTAEGDSLEIMLFPGKPAELPEGHEYTKTMIAQGRLIAAPEDPAPAKKKNKEASDNGG